MKKVGLITFHRPINFGAALQSVALSNAISSLGVDVKILDYINPAFVKAYPVIPKNIFRSPKSFVWSLAMLPSNLHRRRGFRKFVKENTVLTQPLKRDALSSTEKDFDLFITGSDQVWNYRCSGKDPSYFLDFVTQKPKYSYAASFGDDEVVPPYDEIYGSFISRFEAVSVRESVGIDIVKRLCGKDSVKTLDPTLLLNREQWSAMIKNRKALHDKPYILIYFMAQSDEINREMLRAARAVQEKLGYDIVIIGGSLHKKKGDIFYCDVTSPYEFLTLFRDASFVLTNSFHGTAFSVNFRKDFYSYVKPDLKTEGRVQSLLSSIGLSSRIFSYADDIKEIAAVDYTESEAPLQAQIDESYAFVNKAVN